MEELKPRLGSSLIKPYMIFRSHHHYNPLRILSFGKPRVNNMAEEMFMFAVMAAVFSFLVAVLFGVRARRYRNEIINNRVTNNNGMNDENLLAGSKTIFPFPLLRTPTLTGTATRVGLSTTSATPVTEDDTIRQIKDTLRDNWVSMQQILDNVETVSTHNYYLIIAINIAIVTAGIALLSFSIFYSWARGDSLFGAITSGIAVADFVAVFLFNPQTRVRKVLGDKVQMQIIYKTWMNQAVAAYANLVNRNYSAEAIDKFQDDLKKHAKESVELLENNIGND